MYSLKNLSVASGIFMAVFILSIASAQNGIELSSEDDLLESLDEIQELLRKVQILYDMKVASKVQQWTVEDEEEKMDGDNDVNVDRIECNCQGMSCSCCKAIRIRRLGFNMKCCLSLTYVPEKDVIEISLKVGSRTLFTKEIPVGNPQPVCVPLPRMRRGAKVCIEFYDVKFTKESGTGCAKLIARLLSITVANIDLGCFRMGSQIAEQQVEEVELSYLDG